MRSGKGRSLFVALMVLFVVLWADFAAGRDAMDETTGWPLGAGGWKRTGEAVLYKGRAIFDYMDGAGEVYLAYDFKELEVQRFEREGHPAIIAEAYEMGTPQDAFGVFTWDRQDPDAAIGQGSEFGGGLLRFWKGRHFFSVYGEGEGKEQEQAVLEIGRGLASSIAETGEPPLLLRALPEEHRVEQSLRFVRSHVLLNQRCFISNENILGLMSDTEAVFARYDFGKERTFVLVVNYPTEARAHSALASLDKAYKLDGGRPAEAGGTWTGAQMEGRRLVVALHTPTAEKARQLIEATKTRLKEEP
ncbi:MAG: DUF6599 family protein [Syntrophorhabdales bacterium]